MSDIYYDNYMEDEVPPEKSRAQQITGLIFKTLGIAIIVFINFFIFYRIYAGKEPKMAKEYLWNENAVASYNEHAQISAGSDKFPSNEYKVKSVTLGGYTLTDEKGNETNVSRSEYGDNSFKVYTQTLRSYTLTDPDTDKTMVVERSDFYKDGTELNGAFRVTNMYYTPVASQVQVTFRYNHVALEELTKDYALPSVPSGEVYAFTLTDNLGNEYKDYSFTSGTKSVYNYRRLLFDGIKFDNVTMLTLNIYFIDDVTYGSPYISMVIYDANIGLDTMKISGGNTVTKGLAEPNYIVKQGKQGEQEDK